ncbi:MAG: hypothetical protein ACK40H_05675, partial [Sphingomonadaceae bacterium]
GEERLVVLPLREFERLREASKRAEVMARGAEHRIVAELSSGDVCLAREEYERLLAAADMLDDIRLADDARARRESGAATWLDGELVMAAAEGLGAVRSLRGLSIDQLARKAELAADLVDGIERGAIVPDPAQRVALAKALDAPEAILFA